MKTGIQYIFILRDALVGHGGLDRNDSVWNFRFWDLFGIWCLSKKAIGFPEPQKKLRSINHHQEFGLLVADITKFVCNA
jgi:hypothetical protein